jgi:hypothetical protein
VHWAGLAGVRRWGPPSAESIAADKKEFAGARLQGGGFVKAYPPLWRPPCGLGTANYGPREGD